MRFNFAVMQRAVFRNLLTRILTSPWIHMFNDLDILDIACRISDCHYWEQGIRLGVDREMWSLIARLDLAQLCDWRMIKGWLSVYLDAAAFWSRKWGISLPCPNLKTIRLEGGPSFHHHGSQTGTRLGFVQSSQPRTQVTRAGVQERKRCRGCMQKYGAAPVDSFCFWRRSALIHHYWTETRVRAKALRAKSSAQPYISTIG